MKKILYSFLIFYLFISLTSFATTHQEKMVQEAYYAWCKAIGKAKGHPQTIVKFYAPDAILLPTFSGKILVNHDGDLDEYFKKLTSLPEIQCTPKKLITRVYSDIAVNSGLYKFTYKENNKVETVEGRFTFVYQKYGNQWLINKHHSSKLPE